MKLVIEVQVGERTVQVHTLVINGANREQGGWKNNPMVFHDR